MLSTILILAICFSPLNTASLLPLRIEPSISSSPSPSRPQAAQRKVLKTGVAVAVINEQDGIVGLGNNSNKRLQAHAPMPTEDLSIRAALAEILGPQITGGKVNKSSIAAKTAGTEDGMSVDHYNEYRGNGSTTDGWPSKDLWISFADMFNNSKPLFERSCKLYHQDLNTKDEIADVYDSIQSVARSTLVDHRFILAIIMQESGGCVRAPTSDYGVPNPGIMQDHNGTTTCNNGTEDGVKYPCPTEMIERMIQDGTGGTSWGDGLAQCINNADSDDVSAFYQAARIYNSGTVDESGNLEDGIATHCYASDIANRLTGWTEADHDCMLDD